MNDAAPYNPLDKKNLGASVAEAMLAKKVHPLGEVPEFVGAGIYAIYYTGNFGAYAPIAERNKNGRFEAPIYVGKAVPPGARKGNFGLDTDAGNALCKRLREHAESIRLTELDIAAFHCRFLVVDDIWIPLGESLLIAKFAPIWNKLVDGFGNHDPGSGRYNQQRSRWDVLHPGRGWAERCQPRQETSRQIANDVTSFLKVTTLPPLPTLLVDNNNG